MWPAIVLAAALAYLQKVGGYLVGGDVLQRPRVRAAVIGMPLALLSALVMVQAFGDGQGLTIDARAAGLLAAVVALMLRAPFLVVVLVAAVVAAGLRALTGVA